MRHTRPLAVGLNCALGAKELRPYVEELAGLAESYVSCHPNAGLPNAFGEYDDTPESMAAHAAEWARAGWLNLAGGCCGTTPEHIPLHGEALRRLPPPAYPTPGRCACPLEPLNVDDSPFAKSASAPTSPLERFARLIWMGLLGAWQLRASSLNGAKVTSEHGEACSTRKRRDHVTRMIAAEPISRACRS